MIKKMIAFLAALMLTMAPVTASAASIQRVAATQTTHPAAAQPEVRSYSGSHAYSGGGHTYSTGPRSPSSTVGRSYSGGGYGTAGRTGFFGGGLGSHLFSFGGGMLLGSLFHPFGGYYGFGGGYGYHGFSIFSLIFDIIILVVLWKVVRWVLRRR